MNYLINKFAANHEKQPTPFLKYSRKMQVFISESLEGLQFVNDNHAHLCGTSDENQDNDNFYVNPIFSSGFLKKIHMRVFESASGVPDSGSHDHKNKSYINRLTTLIDNITEIVKYQMVLLPMDYYYDKDGTKNKEKTAIFCSNGYVSKVQSEQPIFFKTAVSIHPSRTDALEQLNAAHENGCRIVKWLPNSMNIDPSDPSYDSYYQELIKLDMKLLVHVGEEHSVDCGHLKQQLGNPMLLIRPLEKGVKIVAAHCGSEGTSIVNDVKIDNYKLVFNLMSKYDNLYADISAMLTFKRCGKPLEDALDRTYLHKKFLFGSDYPVPCISCIISTKLLWFHGYITNEERINLDIIYKNNPLLFNLIAFRRITSNFGNKFSNEIFERSISQL